jgi:carbonic anhydrase
VHLPRYAELFRTLAHAQSPHTLFVTCSDSRIQPSLLTSADPGELFLVRNIGNMVPPLDAQRPTSTGAAVEFAVMILGVTEIVVCAHSSCGAIKALRKLSELPDDAGALKLWIHTTEARELCETLPSAVSYDDVARLSALRQLDHLRTYSCVKEREDRGELRLHAWFFHIASGEVEEWDARASRWVTVAAERTSSPSLPLIEMAP